MLTATPAVTLDQAAVDAALAQADAVDATRAAQTKEAGEAQVATRQRDEAMASLRGYLSDLRAVAKVALVAQPQLRETLGILERS